MANKRMFTMNIVDSDAFLDMPLSAQCLYFHLNMRADDDGFIGNPKRIMKIVGASEDDLKLLIAKRFLLCFEDGVIVIKHWRMHNTLSQNRYHETQYIEEKSMLKLKENGSYSFDNGEEIDDKKLINAKEKYDKKQQADKRLANGLQMADSDLDLELDIGLDKDLDKDIDIEKDLINKPPLSPLKCEEKTKDKEKKETAEEMFERVLSDYNISDYLLEAVKDWIDYKKETFRFTYKEKGLKTLFSQVTGNAMKYGDEAVYNEISNSIASGYQGILFDRLKRQSKKENSLLDEWRNA